MTREDAYKILTTLITNENLIKHHIACEATMKALYKRLNKEQNLADEEKWGIVGLYTTPIMNFLKIIPKNIP